MFKKHMKGPVYFNKENLDTDMCCGEFHKKHYELHRYFRYTKFLHPGVLIISVIILYLLFRWMGIKAMGVFFVLFIVKEFSEILFLKRLERRILKPLDKLKDGVEEIAKGNYDIKVECSVSNEVGLLIASFNHMAQKLLESEKIKAEYEENRKKLIANISHDLKTPITSIQGHIEALLDETEIPLENKDKYLQTIYNNTAYMNKLIDDLFLVSKLDMQKLDFRFEELEVKAFMSDLTDEFKFELEEKGIVFQFEDCLEDNCRFKIDRKRLHQSFRNVIGNAVKYGPEKGLVISVRLYEQEACACTDINDNGPGIPEDKIPYIFDRFYRIDSERTKDVMSTGLGLTIARELIGAHGGEITVSSVVGEGSCFTIKLPVIK